MLGDFSRLLNRVLGGAPGKTLCHRWAVSRGPDCLPCRIVGMMLSNPWHCRDEMSAADFIDWLKRKPK